METWVTGRNLHLIGWGGCHRLYNVKPAIPYNKQRDIRTMIDCLQGSNNGYYEAKAKLDEPCIKHVALYNAAYDAFALSELIESLR